MKKTTQVIQNLKNQNKKITALTAYDYSTAKYLDKADVDIILVGDSLAQVVLGYDKTTSVSMDEMLVFVSAVARGVENALVVADMPFMSFQVSIEDAVKNACRFIKAGANAVKIEGISPYLLELIERLTQIGIPVMGHLGFTPMSINSLGGYKIQGKDSAKTLEIMQQALKLQNAGCFSMVLELMPMQSARYISQRLNIPTIGIGAGKYCDGQILVCDDLLGKFDNFKPKYVRQYSSVKDIILNVAKAYVNDVQNGNYPTEEESFILDKKEEEALESNR